MNRGNKRWVAAFAVFVIAAVGCLVAIILMNMKMDRADRQFAELAQSANTVPSPSGDNGVTVAGDISGNTVSGDTVADENGIFYIDDVAYTNVEGIEVPVPYKNLDWDELHELNPDIYAWICVPDTGVDYPILQHPTDNTYYLNYNIDGTRGFPGCIYTEDYNSKDFTDPNTLIYGHNMDDETMFSTLHKFRNADMVNTDHYIFIYTPDEILAYKIFAAYEYPSIHLILNYDYSNEYVYEQYIRDLFNVVNTGSRVANVRNDVEVTKDDRIVTLSTCTTDHDSSKRFLVVGVLLTPGE